MARKQARILAFVAACLMAVKASADELHVICSTEQDWCDLMASEFEQEFPDTSVILVRYSTGDALSLLRAQAADPQFDIWWGGTGDPHLIAAKEGLIQQSGVPFDGLHSWAANMLQISDERTVGIYAGALGIAYNAEVLAQRGIAPPECWADLADARFFGEIQVANPNSSGTAYTEVATLVQIFGWNDAYDLLARIGHNVNTYTSSGSAPSKAAARGETGVSIGFMHDMVKLVAEGSPLEIVAPCEGTGYEVGAVSVIERARNFEMAQQWVAFALRPDVQSMAANVRAYQLPSHMDATVPPEAPDFSTIDLIDYDFMAFGNSDIRDIILERWEEEVGDVPLN